MIVLSEDNGKSDGTDEQRAERAGRSKRHVGYYDIQRTGMYGEGGVSSTLNARDYKAATDLVVETPRKYVIRRLTPLECCRLQGFPDYWESGVEGSDSARYKMWGNGMTLPVVLYVLQGIADVLKEETDG